VGTRVGVEGCGKFVPTGIRSPDRISRGDYTDYTIPAVVIIIFIIIASNSSSSRNNSSSISTSSTNST